MPPNLSSISLVLHIRKASYEDKEAGIADNISFALYKNKRHLPDL